MVNIKKIRQYALVCISDDYKKMCADNKIKSELETDDLFIYIGEIPNMCGHCVVIGTTTKKAHIGYHLEDFRELSEEEV